MSDPGRPVFDIDIDGMQIHVVPEEQLGSHGAAYVAAALRAGVAARGRATVAFSGGSGARPLLTALADTDVPWPSVHVLQVDERVAPDRHADRNFTLLSQVLLDRIDIAPDHIHPMPVTESDLATAAARYARIVEQLAGCPPKVDVVHLGIGSDGHTASLPPGTDLLQDGAGAVGVTRPFQGHMRMTLTGPTLSSALHLLWLVSGAAKASVVRRFIDHDAALPAVHINRSRALLLLDLAAAS